MNYTRIYHSLMDRALTRDPLLTYVERHHIVPRCMNGSNAKSNIAILTPEEHFLAHQLLVKMHPERPSLIWALARMMCGNPAIKHHNKWYGWIRRRFAAEMSKPKSIETRRKMSEYWTKHRADNPVTDEQREEMRQRQTGTKHSEETKQKMSKSHIGKTFSEESRRKMSEAKLGKKKPPRSAEYAEQQSLKMKQVWAERRAKKVQNEGNRA